MGLVKILKDASKVSLGVVTAYLPMGCVEESEFPAPLIYQQPLQKLNLPLLRQNTFYDAFGFNTSDIDRTTKIGNQLVAVLKEGTKVPGLKYHGRVWVTFKDNKLHMGCVGDTRPFAEFWYDAKQENIYCMHWKNALKGGKILTPIPEYFSPSKEATFCFRNTAEWAKLLEFDSVLKAGFGDSLFPEDAIAKAVAYSEPKRVLSALEISIGNLEKEVAEGASPFFRDNMSTDEKLRLFELSKGTAFIFQALELEDIITRYNLLVKNIRIQEELKMLRARLIKLYSSIREKYKDEKHSKLSDIESLLNMSYEEAQEVFSKKEQ